MGRCQKCLSFERQILDEMEEAAKNCCGGNVSEYVRRLHNGAHSASRIKMTELERVIRKVVKEEIKE